MKGVQSSRVRGGGLEAGLGLPQGAGQGAKISRKCPLKRLLCRLPTYAIKRSLKKGEPHL